ncbi:MAG TPA: trypsin-like peptidase domain-containing protein [Thermoanaerobaculia bacterium]|jgi:hypothetical protein
MLRRRLVYLCSVVLLSAVMQAQRAEPYFHREAVGVRAPLPPPRIAEKAAMSPAASLAAANVAEPDRIWELRRWNEEGKLPAKNGFARAVGQRVAVRIGAAVAQSAATGAKPFGGGVIATTARGVAWGATFNVAGSYRLRLRLDNILLPEDALLWVYGEGENPIAFGRELIDDEGGIWTPSVGGPTVFLELEMPAGAEAAFDVQELMEIVGADPRSEDLPTCLIDASCVATSILDVVEEYRRSTAQLQYAKNGGNFVCSGALVNAGNSGIPYLLTANHCFSTAASATSLEAFWDYRTPFCNGPIPQLGSMQRSNGSALLATSAASDFTFVKLNSIPAGRWFMGWDARTASVPHGAVLHRISYPFPNGFPAPLSQTYTGRLVNTVTSTCNTLPRPNFVYSQAGVSGTYGGSSGSPTILSGGRIVGQLYGACGPAPADGCDLRNYAVDGALSSTYPSIATYLNTTSLPPCGSNSITACLSGKRFKVTVKWKTANGQSGDGQAIEYTPESALFWFFGSTNIEMILKILNGCGLNQRYWVFAAATTDVEYTITVTDTKTGTVKTYFKGLGTPAPAVTDTGAFASCP